MMPDPLAIPPHLRDRLRDTYSRDTLELVAYLSLLWLRGDEGARERLAVLLGELERV